MARTTVSILKFVGTISLGLLTGVSYTTSTQSIPALLAFPTASSAYLSFQHHQRSTAKHLRALAFLTASSYCLAFALSPRKGGRHPYLLWTSLITVAGNGIASYLWTRVPLPAWADKENQSSRRQETEEDDYIDATGSPSRSAIFNGEEVRVAMERWRSSELVRGGISGLGFVMAVIGIWGDGLGIRAATT